MLIFLKVSKSIVIMVILTWIASLNGGTAYSFSAKYNIQPLIINAADMVTFIFRGGSYLTAQTVSLDIVHSLLFTTVIAAIPFDPG
jgi:hypothetical protein